VPVTRSERSFSDRALGSNGSFRSRKYCHRFRSLPSASDNGNGDGDSDSATRAASSLPAAAQSALPALTPLVTTSSATTSIEEEEQNASWIVLSALEKAKEKELVAVARWVSLLESVMPNHNHQPGMGRTASAESRRRRVLAAANAAANNSINSASEDVVSLPDVVARAKKSAESFEGNPWWGINGDDVRILLHATRHGKRIDLQTVLALLEGATAWLRIFRRTTKVVVLPPLREHQTLTVVGDLHGSLSDLATVLAVMPGEEPTENNLLLFNGDLADRGDHGIETICIVCALCLAYPQHVMVNRGNHEDLALATAYDLVRELHAKYFENLEEEDADESLLSMTKTLLDNFFRALPLATLVEDDALIVHAGPPPPGSLPLKQLLCNIREGSHPLLAGKGLSRTIVDSVGTVCPSLKESQEVIESMLWSDPWVDETGTVLEEEEQYCHHHLHRHHNRHAGCNGSDSNGVDGASTKRNADGDPLGWHPNHSRGAGFRYDAGVIRRFLQKEGLTRMVRSHETVQRGCARYEIPPAPPSSDNDHQDQQQPMELFTIFSASRYPAKEGFNQGAILELRAGGQHQITRYATEDDDPMPLAVPTDTSPIEATASTTESTTLTAQNRNNLETRHDSFHQHRQRNERCNIGLDDIQENLFEAIRHHEGAVLRSLRSTALELPYSFAANGSTAVLSVDAIVDSLIETLHLEGVKTRAARTVLALALGIKSFHNHQDDNDVATIELETFCDSVRQISKQGCDDESVKSTTTTEQDPWVSSLFDLLDENRDGYIDRSEWARTVSGHERFAGIDAEVIRDLLDANGDGKVSGSEWERLGDAMDHVNGQIYDDVDVNDEVLEG